MHVMLRQIFSLSSAPEEAVTDEQPDQTSFLSNLGFQAMQPTGVLGLGNYL